MRVLSVLVALVAVPLAVSAAQGRAQSASDRGKCATADAHRSPSSLAHAEQRSAKDKDGERNGCSPFAAPAPAPAPAPPPPPPPPPAPEGSVAITGRVYNAITGKPGLAGWTVTLSGAVSTALRTDANGVYTFSGLPAGTYTVCEQIPAGWVQTAPQSGSECASGYGYEFTLELFSGASFVNFGNLVQ